MATQTFYVNIFPTTLLQEDIISFWGGKKRNILGSSYFLTLGFFKTNLAKNISLDVI